MIKTKKSSSKQPTDTKNEKFDNYFDFEIPVKYIKPHQVLAINRGENLKILSVKVVVPESFFNEFCKNCFKKWSKSDQNILKRAIEDSYSRLGIKFVNKPKTIFFITVEPLIKREVRAELKQKAERASCEVFSTNLKDLLLAPPLKGKPILGIDPGYSNGCKLALISPLGALVDSNVIYPHKTKTERDTQIIKNMLLGHKYVSLMKQIINFLMKL